MSGFMDAEPMEPIPPGHNEGEPPLDLDVPLYADVHENGQLRLGIPGEQMPMLPLPDDDIPYDPSNAPLPEGF